MTTTVIVKANHGWPVEVTERNPETGETGLPRTVEPNTEQTFYVHGGADLHIHEVPQASGVEAEPGEPVPADDATNSADPADHDNGKGGPDSKPKATAKANEN